MILITGATGRFGNATIDFLLAKGTKLARISALVSDRKKAVDLLSKGIIVKIGDFDNYTTLVDAFQGADKLLLVSGTDSENRGTQHESAVKAAKAAGVKHIFFTCYGPETQPEDLPVGRRQHTNHDTENVIKESGIAYTILSTKIHTDMLPFYLDKIKSENYVVFAAGEIPNASSFPTDMAEATATILLEEGHENKEYYLSNTEILATPNK